MAYDVIVNKKFNNVRLYVVRKSVKGKEQNKISKMLSALVAKYVLKRSVAGEGQR